MESSFYTRILNISDYITEANIESVKLRMDKLVMPEPNTGCHLWMGMIFNGGYGRMWIKDKQFMVHRVAYFLNYGSIPEKLVIDHLCNTPSCVNPQHLEAKTQKENGLRAQTSLTTQNYQKTHCKRGHEFTIENTRITSDGRSCRTCEKEYKRKWFQENKQRIYLKYKRKNGK